jgi:hypothetical protein
LAYSRDDIERLWVQEGGDPNAAPVAAAVALAESGGNQSATNHNTNGSTDKGLFQIISIHGPLSSYDLKRNVKAAIKISSGGRDWSPWVTYKTGAYKKFLSKNGSLVGAGRSRAPDSQASGTRTVPGRSLAPERGAAALAFLGSGRNDASNNLDFALQIRGLQDTPSRTVQTPLRRSGGSAPGGGSTADDLTARANALDSRHLPYQWGGGHGSKPVDPYDAVPVDCSGAVSSVLGINPRVSGEFTKWGKPGDGGSHGVTVAANGHHVIMKINGHWFGTSPANPGGGAGWIPQARINPQYLRGFTLRHMG